MYITMYTGNPTAGATDGTPVSSMGSLTSPIGAMVEAGQKVVVPCAVRCVAGYIGYVTLSTATREGSSYVSGSDWIELSEDGENWGSSVQLMDVTDTNKLFYVRIAGGETGGADDTGAIRCYAEVEEDE